MVVTWRGWDRHAPTTATPCGGSTIGMQPHPLLEEAPPLNWAPDFR